MVKRKGSFNVKHYNFLCCTPEMSFGSVHYPSNQSNETSLRNHHLQTRSSEKTNHHHQHGNNGFRFSCARCNCMRHYLTENSIFLKTLLLLLLRKFDVRDDADDKIKLMERTVHVLHLVNSCSRSSLEGK